MMRYLVHPFVPGFGSIIPMVADTEELADALALDYLRHFDQGVCIVTMRSEDLDTMPSLTLVVYAGLNVPRVL